ncbi:hypothetical protein LTSEMON_0467 [Salmonella enterica subsp. enterica serovar Montevideo str. S5-403]|uniref:Uncharacterized protein n=1 Tax=Salmonella enterica subsp. enterica serovar Montevideo str. S5-403 TaxID=913242 RepID=G5PYI3_SALMO|nr:hypothetical protein LTSEMON_0467 [Salmonella enterica subsp. enterica serovar Montevideo str. S5-403]
MTCFFHYKNGQWQAISYFFLAARGFILIRYLRSKYHEFCIYG